MRKVIVFNLLSLDGFYEGPNRELDWFNVDGEFHEFAAAQMNSTDLLLFGRATYQHMESWWPTEQGIASDPVIADRMNNIQKIVVSRTLDKAEWNNTTLIKQNVAEEITKLKQQPGEDIFIFGSGELASCLNSNGLIDEFRLMINPVALGRGNAFFKGLNERLNLKLLKTKTFDSGNVLLYYETVA
ncbi:MAG: dihydrofolate reductase family protein [Bacteroidetes bacterium]|nr:dihydrofolate reductase family protein [Bacteroidota bacterium]